MKNDKIKFLILYLMLFAFGLVLGITRDRPEKKSPSCMFIDDEGTVTMEHTGRCICMFDDYAAVISCKVNKE